MHRNTRRTLKAYFQRGLLAAPPPERQVLDVRFDYQDRAERSLYDAVTSYIDARYEALEQEQAGKGFVMTVYRRRAASSPQALRRSLKRRQENLRRYVQQMAIDVALPVEDIPEAIDLDELPEGDEIQVPLGMPDDSAAAVLEIQEIDKLLARLADLGNTDSKRDRFLDELRRATDDGRPLLVFTEYKDTMEYVRDALLPHFGATLGCYSGDGGQRWEGDKWIPVAKDVITRALQKGELGALICTDAASEGLNLQAAGALVNYDLPWNPSRVEQRIGRIDRIGQTYPAIRVVNLLLRDSVDDQVYGALRRRCHLFERFVGAMQPVLALARRMLLSPTVDTSILSQKANEVQGDLLANETYVESEASVSVPAKQALNRQGMELACELVDGSFGPSFERRGGLEPTN